MADVQKTFNKAIMAGLYSSSGNVFMCNAIVELYKKGIITEQEMSLALGEIISFIGDSFTLRQFLNGSRGFPMDRATSFETCLPFYEDWANRYELLKEYR